MGFDGVEHKVGGFLEEGVNAEVEGVEVGRQGVGSDGRVGVEFGERGGEVEGLFGRRGGDCVEKCSQEVGVVDAERELDKDVLVAEVGFLDATATCC